MIDILPQYLIYADIIVAIASIIGFFVSYRQNKIRLLNGFLFLVAFFSTLIGIVALLLSLHNPTIRQVVIDILVILMVPIIVLYACQGTLFLWNAFIVWHKESHSLANMLTLIIGLFIVTLPFFKRQISYWLPAKVSDYLLTFLSLFLFYLVACFACFITSALIYSTYRPKKNKDYLIVLGSGLINGDQVPPLLAARIDKGIEFFNQQKASFSHPPLFICSGGQGGDEKLPEGLAMKNYAVEHGIDPKYAVAEEKSKNTIENMKFSERIIQKLGLDIHNGIFVTSDYHVFRAGVYARQAGLDIDGIGAKTSKFFIPNAVIREYVAMFLKHKYFHIFMIIVLIILTALIVKYLPR